MYSVVLLMAAATGSEGGASHYNGCLGGSAYHGGGVVISSGCLGYSGGGGGVSCIGGGACYGSGYWGSCSGGVIISGGGCCGGTVVPKEKEKDKDKDKEKGKGKDTDKPDTEEVTSSTEAPARIIVKVAEGATLTVDGHATKSTAAVRTFQSPALQPGRTFTYTLQAEVVKDGEKVVVTKKVEVEAGKTTNVDLTSAEVASK